MAKERPKYLSYLLRLWRANGQAADDRDEASAVWLASLESSRTHERWAFRTLEELFDYLRGETGAARDADEHREADG